ncbi:MAG: class I SAM-dependent methyltransferase [Proteobacteria bacterium]|nr:MAG: class I SAM-dependent methyltransferase [Pseudomonadota bacterium]
MDQEQFLAAADQVAREIGVFDGIHGYFRTHVERLYRCCLHFGLFEGSHGDVLEIGPFYSYTPIVLRERARSYHVIEADDPAVYPIVEAYRAKGVACEYLDLFDVFGGVIGASRRLPFADASFDTVLCWEVMEHFNFNPVPFVRELYRVLKPGGVGYLSVPNRASLAALTNILFGVGQDTQIDQYFQFADYRSGEKVVFYGFHWREYTLREFSRLFSKQGFEILNPGHLLTFFSRNDMTLSRQLTRKLAYSVFPIIPNIGNLNVITVRKPLNATAQSA